MKLWKTTIAGAFALALTATACTLGDIEGGPGVLGIDDGASGGTKESLKVDGTAEVKLELSTGAALTVPKGAVDHDVVLGVERPTDAKAVELVQSLKSTKAVASAPYVLTPHGTEFQKGLKLEIPITKNGSRDLVAAYLKDENDREWKYLDAPTVEKNVATVTLKHFSVIVLLDREDAELEMEVPADEEDAGAPVDSSAAEDAGTAFDAETKPEEQDAGSAQAPDASATMDAGSAHDAGSAMDAGTQAQPDASAQPVDAASTLDTGTGQGADASAQIDSGSALPDAAVEVDAYVPPQDDAAIDAGGGSSDAGDFSDASATVDATATVDASQCSDGGEPQMCQVDWCGTMSNGCGGEMNCGNCEGGGVCGFYEPNVCGYPVG